MEKSEQEQVCLVVILLSFSQKENVENNMEEIPKGFGRKKTYRYDICLLKLCDNSIYRTAELIFKSCIANKKDSSKLGKPMLPIFMRREINKYGKITY